MAKNREPEKPVESESESGEENSEASSESESEQELADPQIKNPSSAPNPKNPQTQYSSDDEESGSESESESDSDGPDPNAKPLASKPIDEPKKIGIAKKTSAMEVLSPLKTTGTKRPAEEKDVVVKDNKRSKKKVEAEPVNSAKDVKKPSFQRVWSEDDEIVVLKGMADYSTKKKSDPVVEIVEFHDFIKKNLQAQVTSVKLKEKIKRLKKKYENNKNKEITKPHEVEAHELSKKVWGDEIEKEIKVEKEKVVATPKANGRAVRMTPKSPIKSFKEEENQDSEEVKSEEVVDRDVWSLVLKVVSSDVADVEARILRIGAALFEGDKGIGGENIWKNLRVEEMELHLKKLDLVRAQTKLVLDALNSTDH